MSSVRHYDWIAHFGRRTPDKSARHRPRQRPPASPTRSSMRGSRGLPPTCATRSALQRGDRVAVLALNTTDTLEVQFACGRIGAVFLPLNTRLTVPELQFIVGDASPKVMIHDTDLAETALDGRKALRRLVALQLGPGGSYEAAIAASTPLDRGGESSRSMTSRPSCTPRARQASRRARSSPTA